MPESTLIVVVPLDFPMENPKLALALPEVPSGQGPEASFSTFVEKVPSPEAKLASDLPLANLRVHLALPELALISSLTKLRVHWVIYRP